MPLPLTHKPTLPWPILGWFMPLLLLAAYALLFPGLYEAAGQRALAFGYLVSVLSGALLGLRGGLAYGLVASLLIGYLATRYGGYGVSQVTTVGIPMTLVTMLTGGGVGFMRDLIVRFKQEVKARQRTEEALREAKERAEAANLAKSQLLANMSHEFRTPLNHILGFTELLVDRHFGPLNQVQEGYLRDVMQSGGRLLSLVDDLLALAGIESDKMVLQLSEVNPQALLAEALRAIEAAAVGHGIALSLEVAGIPEKIRADEGKFKQILHNLLANALKFTPDGGTIRLVATLGSAPTARRSAHEPPSASECLEVSVIDSGIGIEPEEMERIFTAFQQGRPQQGRSPDGSGLGLALARKMVELHGGRLVGESAGKGKGSTFRFTLPVAP